MKISVDGKQLFELSETQKNVIKNDIQDEIFVEDMHRRLKYILMHKYEQCFKALCNEWMPKMKERYSNLPSNDEELAQLIMSQPDYKNRSKRENKV